MQSRLHTGLLGGLLGGFLVLAACGVGGIAQEIAQEEEDEGETGTPDQAQEAATAALDTSLSALTTIEEGISGLELAEEARSTVQTDIAATDSCAAGTVPAPAGSLFSGTLNGTIGGSCTITADETDEPESTGSVLLDCSSLDNGEGVVINGQIGFAWTGEEESATDQITSSDLTMAFSDGTSCAVVLNLTVARECNTATTSGCLSVCGTPFSVTQSDTLEGFCEDETPLDETAPTITSCVPDHLATDVTKQTTITCTFSEALDSQTVTTASVTLTDEDSAAILGTVSSSTDGAQVTFTPDAPLTPNTSYTLAIGTGVTDAAGNPLAAAHQTSFTTDCSGDAEFDDDNELGCFTLYKLIVSPISASQETLPGSFLDSATVASGRLTLDHNTTNSHPMTGMTYLSKQLAAGDFAVELLIAGGMPSNGTEAIGVGVFGTASENDDFAVNYVHFLDDAGLEMEIVSFVNGDMDVPAAAGVNGAATVYLRLSRSGSTITYAYKTSAAADYTTLATETRTTAGDIIGGDSETLSVGIAGWTENTLGTFAPQIDHFRFLTGSAAGQE